MSPLLAVTMLFFAIVGGIIGWRRASKPIYRRSLFEPDPPSGMSRRDYERIVRQRRKRWRLFVTLVYAAIGAAVAIIFLFVFRR